MRAVVLSNDRNIEFLNENFINTWVLYTDMKRHRDAKGIDAIQPLARTIIQGWKKHSPADCLIISPELKLLGRQPVNELSSKRGEISTNYHTFLVEALAKKSPGLGVVVLTAEQPAVEVLNIFRTPAAGYQDYTSVEIDTTAFEHGGTLTIHIQVGNTEAAGSFDLFEGNKELPTKGTPDDALASAWDVVPGKTGKIIYRFHSGRYFKLGATGNWFSEKGSVNAFSARISVESESDRSTKAKKRSCGSWKKRGSSGWQRRTEIDSTKSPYLQKPWTVPYPRCHDSTFMKAQSPRIISPSASTIKWM